MREEDYHCGNVLSVKIRENTQTSTHAHISVQIVSKMQKRLQTR